MSILKRLAQKAGANYAAFEWGGEHLRLYRMPVEHNLRAFEEAMMITRDEVSLINPRFKDEPINEEQWAKIADSLGSTFFEKPKNRWEQLVQLCQMSSYGKLVTLDCIKDSHGQSLYEGEPAEGETKEQAISRSRMEMYELITMNADLQGILRKASNELLPGWMKDSLDRGLAVTPAKKKRPPKRR